MQKKVCNAVHCIIHCSISYIAAIYIIYILFNILYCGDVPVASPPVRAFQNKKYMLCKNEHVHLTRISKADLCRRFHILYIYI